MMSGQSYQQVQDALRKQGEFVNALNGAQGVQNQADVYRQYADIAAGRGPNPAQAMLKQATGQNVAQTGAMMASSRGASANPGMIARQAGMAGGNLQQQAAGQGATLQAQQSLGALDQMGGIANEQIGQQMTGQQMLSQNRLGQYQAASGLQGNINSNNTSLANSNRDLAGKIGGGLLQGGAGGLGLFGSGDGGGGGGSGFMMNKGPGSTMNNGASYAGGGEIPGSPAPAGPRSALGQALMAKGGKVPAKVSPGEIYLSPQKAKAVAKGKASPLSGERIKGKAKVKGDSYANDTVKKTLQSGGVVIPRSKALGDDVAEKATAFVRAVMAKGRH